MQTKITWWHVNERLPEYDGNYIVAWEDNVQVAFWKDQTFFSPGPIYPIYDVDFWCHFPPHPDDVEENNYFSDLDDLIEENMKLLLQIKAEITRD